MAQNYFYYQNIVVDSVRWAKGNLYGNDPLSNNDSSKGNDTSNANDSSNSNDGLVKLDNLEGNETANYSINHETAAAVSQTPGTIPDDGDTVAAVCQTPWTIPDDGDTKVLVSQIPGTISDDGVEAASVSQPPWTIPDDGDTKASFSRIPGTISDDGNTAASGSQTPWKNAYGDGDESVVILDDEDEDDDDDTDNKDILMTCHFCEIVFTDKSAYEEHSLTHTGAKPFRCTKCGECYLSKTLLARHKVYSGSCGHFSKGKHVEDRPHACLQCGVKFKQKGNLNVHMRIHSGDKPFKCDFCGNCYVQSTKLKRHLRSHFGRDPLFPFLCGVERCSAQFSDPKVLTDHCAVNHEDQRPFRCLEKGCNAAFKFRKDFINHAKHHKHGDQRTPVDGSTGSAGCATETWLRANV